MGIFGIQPEIVKRITTRMWIPGSSPVCESQIKIKRFSVDGLITTIIIIVNTILLNNFISIFFNRKLQPPIFLFLFFYRFFVSNSHFAYLFFIFLYSSNRETCSRSRPDCMTTTIVQLYIIYSYCGIGSVVQAMGYIHASTNLVSTFSVTNVAYLAP